VSGKGKRKGAQDNRTDDECWVLDDRDSLEREWDRIVLLTGTAYIDLIIDLA